MNNAGMNSKLSIRSLVSLAVFAVAGLSHADLIANFDGLSEGQIFTTFTNGGIRFHDVTRHQGAFTNFVIEDASNGLAGFTAPNVLAFGGYMPGPEMAFGALGGFWFTSDTEALTAGLDLWTLPLDMGGNTITLTGYESGLIVDSVSFTFGNSFTPIHQRLDLQENVYTTFMLSSSGPAVSGDSFVNVDNVTVAAVPEPATLTVLGLAFTGLARRRMRRSG